MDLKTYYDQLDDKATPPKTKFVEQVMADTGKARVTVYRWLSGAQRPDKANQEKLAKITGIAVDKLFPEEVKVEE